MKAEEMRSKTAEELNAEVAELNQEIFNLKFQLHTGHLENTSRISQVRREIARIKTVIAEKRS
ncbi:MAG: 50S ribosomal protein L29 [Deltaproteobacteria bacterium]|jgi:large subunit ribosomal protein L29|nr:50S ribosomal protein L29 [Deltaproteobacteria bacterium]MBW2510897.1 50S ribosomal protein L29 [Deltaproteobacteria bacterium]MDH4006859.1 50S ribosomal protein L29 [Desulfuromonadales bacterium]HKJ29380.1 50S ribosomal protein L29 [Desulfuromonadales bacterium]